ncbi:NDP-glycosyltransferase YjiC-like [Brevipalpus obovatus]|uniref:NDP-glycosyltransferase YjiC-like n=1 Tax=Brevipalpus obovatus TaxID=246614 RepID=UPI003D9ED693
MKMRRRNFRILITSITAYGHINCVVGFGEMLHKRGHTVIFAQREDMRHIAQKRGFQFIPFDEDIFEGSDPQPFHTIIEETAHLFHKDPIEALRSATDEDKEREAKFLDDLIRVDEAIGRILARNGNIDMVISDLIHESPSLVKSGILHVPLISTNPLLLYHANGIPVSAGFATNQKGSALVEEYKMLVDSVHSLFNDRLRNWYISSGTPQLVERKPFGSIEPTHFGFYHYPQDLDYHEFEPREAKWNRVDACVREPDSSRFEIPEKLKNLPGKLIYFSMGSLASIDLGIMRQLLAILSGSPHRFIVSTGARGHELSMYDNMWGDKYLDQIAVLQTVDLVITHGGNNTLVETLYYGKPMIVIPYFVDQLDNAQRVFEKGLGRRINIWNLDEEKLLGAIEHVLGDNEIRERVERISDNLKKSKNREKAVEMIECLIEENIPRIQNDQTDILKGKVMIDESKLFETKREELLV